MKKLFFTLPFLFFLAYSFAQNTSVICNIPSILDENSGIVVSDLNQVWLHNDGGDSAKFYALDTLGNILRTVLVQDVTNADWEDMTKDDQGNIYVGDFGNNNNNNNRQNLRIYKIPDLDSVQGGVVQTEVIQFYYPEQTAFPAPDADKNYDAEGLIYFQDSLFIFIKDRTTPHQGYTRLYQVPADTGMHAAILLDSFPTGQSHFISEITGAEISPSQNKVAIININKVWVFSNFVGSDFFGGIVQSYNLGSTNQKEALDFVDDNLIYYSNENSFLGSPKLYKINFTTPLSRDAISQEVVERFHFFPNPNQGQLNVVLELATAQKVTLQLCDVKGRIVRKLHHTMLNRGEQRLSFDLNDLAKGIYFVRIKAGKQKMMKRLVIY